MTRLVLVQIVFVPVLMSVVVYLSSKRLADKTGWLACGTLLYTLALALIAASQGTLVEEYSWAATINLTFGLRLDGLNTPFVLTILVLSTVICIFSIPYMQHRIGGGTTQYGVYFALYLLYATGMVGTCLATNLIEFYLFYELMLIPSYFMIAQWGYGDREQVSFMYFIWTHAGALLLLAGILATSSITGTFDVYEIPALLSQLNVSLQTQTWICMAMLIGFMVKLAAFGLHIWLPYAHAEAPTPISALLSPAMIGIGSYAIVRLPLSFFPQVFQHYRGILSLWALITIVYGSLMALAQDDIKRLLAYSSISQMGYIVLGISSLASIGLTGSMFHYISHGTCKGLLFMVAGTVILQTGGLRSIKKLGGLASRMPLTALAALIGFLGIMGTPPLNGFQSEWMLFSGVFSQAVSKGSSLDLIVAIVGILATVLTAVYGLWTVRRVFFGPLPDHLAEVRDPPLTVVVPLLVLAVLTVAIGIYPSPVLDALVPAISSLLGG
jgi:NADH-quinone oxidoreductase subunit M